MTHEQEHVTSFREIVGPSEHMPRVLLATISGRSYHNWFAECRDNAILHGITSGYLVNSTSITDCRIDTGREIVADRCLASKVLYEYLIYVDDDMALPVDLVPRLVSHSKEYDADVVGCLYTARGSSPVCPISEALGGGPMQLKNALDYHERKAVVEVGAVGFGCTLIRVPIFAKLTKPYFYLNETGEDWNFCHAVQRAGGKVFCDFGVTSQYKGKTYPGVAHLGVYPYSLKDSECT